MKHLKSYMPINHPNIVVIDKSNHPVYLHVNSFAFRRIKTYNAEFKTSFYLLAEEKGICLLLHENKLMTYTLTYEGMLRCVRKRQFPIPQTIVSLEELSSMSLGDLVLMVLGVQ